MHRWNMSPRKPIDVDIFVPEGQQPPPGKFDIIYIPRSLYEKIPTDKESFVTMDAIYTIKCSHLGWDIKWNKHAKDVLWLKNKGCRLIPELYDAFVNHWRETNGNKPFLSLYKTKSNFFNDKVTYVYDHD